MFDQINSFSAVGVNEGNLVSVAVGSFVLVGTGVSVGEVVGVWVSVGNETGISVIELIAMGVSVILSTEHPIRIKLIGMMIMSLFIRLFYGRKFCNPTMASLARR